MFNQFSHLFLPQTVSAADLKFIITQNAWDMLFQSVDAFISWRANVCEANADPTSEVPSQSRLIKRVSTDQRFNVVSIDSNESLHVLTSRLLSSKQQRIFLSSDTIARVVGIVSARDILLEVKSQIMQASVLGMQVRQPRRRSGS